MLFAIGAAEPASGSKLSRYEPFAKEMYREKTAMDLERRCTYGNARDSASRKSGRKSVTDLPAEQYYVQIR
jgi:hypothetical protein